DGVYGFLQPQPRCFLMSKRPIQPFQFSHSAGSARFAAKEAGRSGSQTTPGPGAKCLAGAGNPQAKGALLRLMIRELQFMPQRRRVRRNAGVIATEKRRQRAPL